MEDAHHLFDELLRHVISIAVHGLNGILVALARAPASIACSNGPAFAVALFAHTSRGEDTLGMCLQHPHGLLLSRALPEPSTCLLWPPPHIGSEANMGAGAVFV
jgi:hypothetical protein